MDEKEIINKINEGVYQLSDKRKGKSTVWTLFAEVKINGGDDGAILENFVYCRKCKNLLKHNGKQTSNLLRHKCFKLISGELLPKQISTEDKKEAIDICSQWLIEDGRPVVATEGNGFKKMVQFFIKIGATYGEHVDIVDILPDSTSISRRTSTEATQLQLPRFKYSPEYQDDDNEDDELVQTRILTPTLLRSFTHEERSMSPPGTSTKKPRKSPVKEVSRDSSSIVEPIILRTHQQQMQQQHHHHQYQQPFQQQLQTPSMSQPSKPRTSQNFQEVLPPFTVGNLSQQTVMQAFGHYVSIQLQDMDRRQRIISEKLISDVLFHGRLGNMMETTAITLQHCSGPPSQSAPPTFNSFQEAAAY